MSDQALAIRPLESGDIAAITRIYAHYVLHSTITFDLEVPSQTHMAKKFAAMMALGHPVIVGYVNDKLVGYAYASTYRSRPAYRFTCENSIYLDPEIAGKGFGTLLMAQLIEEARASGFRQMLAVIAAGADASVAIHQKFGFKTIGTHPELGFKFDRWLDVVHMQRAL